MENEVLGRVHSVETFGAVDGPGIRYVVFTQGCPLRCLYCHNPDSWEVTGGTETSSKNVADDIAKYKAFLKHGGVTLSGGEPLLQPDFSADILKRCKKMGLHTALDTAGTAPISESRKVVEQADLLLLDVKSANEGLALKLTGRGLEFVKNMLTLCDELKKSVWIRHVLVPTLTLDFKLVDELGDFLLQYKCVEKVELLPFHKMGEYKWKNLGLDYKLEAVQPPSAEEVEQCRAILERKGFKTR